MSTTEETPDERRRRLSREKSARYRAANPDANRKAKARARATDPEKAREANRKANRKARATPEGLEKAREQHREYQNRRRADDPEYKLADVARSRMRGALRAALAGKSARSLKLLGCTAAEFKAHLEGLFQQGMTWENWSPEGWHVDHVRPLASFDLTDPAQQAEAFNFKNTAPVWADENLSKGSLHEGLRHRYRRGEQA